MKTKDGFYMSAGSSIHTHYSINGNTYLQVYINHPFYSVTTHDSNDVELLSIKPCTPAEFQQAFQKATTAIGMAVGEALTPNSESFQNEQDELMREKPVSQQLKEIWANEPEG